LSPASGAGLTEPSTSRIVPSAWIRSLRGAAAGEHLVVVDDRVPRARHAARRTAAAAPDAHAAANGPGDPRMRRTAEDRDREQTADASERELHRLHGFASLSGFLPESTLRRSTGQQKGTGRRRIERNLAKRGAQRSVTRRAAPEPLATSRARA
jgi:hypothetical protein